MTTRNIAALPDFDMAEQLRDAEDIAVYLQLALDDEDPSELAHALGVIARARGMTEIAQKSGMTREALYKALRPGSSPRFETQQSHESPGYQADCDTAILTVMNTRKNKTKDWQSFLALEPLDEDLPRIRDNGESRDLFRDWNSGKTAAK